MNRLWSLVKYPRMRARGCAVRTLVVAALAVTGSQVIGSPAAASDEVTAFQTSITPSSGQVGGPNLLTTSAGIGLLSWSETPQDANHNALTTRWELRQNTGAGWSPLTLDFTGITDPTVGAAARFIEDPVTGRVYVIGQTGSGVWGWISTDGGLSFSSPHYIGAGPFGLGPWVSDGAGGMYAPHYTWGTGFRFAHIGPDLQPLDQNSFVPYWDDEPEAPAEIASVGVDSTPVSLFSDERNGIYARFGLEPHSSKFPLSNAGTQIAGSPAGAVLEWHGGRPCSECTIVRSITSGGVLGPEVVLHRSTSGYVEDITTTAGKPNEFVVAYENYEGKTVVARTVTGPNGPWQQTQVLSKYRTDFVPLTTTVSGNYIAGGGYRGDNSVVIWATDTGPISPSVYLGGSYSPKKHRLRYLLNVDSASVSRLTLTIKAGKRSKSKAVRVRTDRVDGFIKYGKVRLPRKLRLLAASPKAKLSLRVVSSSGPAARTVCTTRVRQKPLENKTHFRQCG